MKSESRRRLAAIAARWNDVERRMKEVELLRGETILAAVNELRYTGRRIADVLLLLSEDCPEESMLVKIDEHLIVAENYLINADHDLTDAAVLFVSLRVQRIIEAHGIKKLKATSPDFDPLSSTLDEAKRIVIESRGNRQARTEFYDRLARDHVPKLIQLYKSLTSHAELKLPEGDVKKGLQLVTILAVIGVLAGVGTFIFHFLGWLHPSADMEQIKSVIEQALKAH